VLVAPWGGLGTAGLLLAIPTLARLAPRGIAALILTRLPAGHRLSRRPDAPQPEREDVPVHVLRATDRGVFAIA
jgi:hypothetical protein